MACHGSIWPLNVPEPHLLAWSITCAILSPITVTFNALLIAVMFKIGDTKSITSNLVIVMSISDIGIGSIVLPLIFAMVTFEGLRQNCAFQSATQFAAFSFGYMSFFMLIAIAVDRYIRMSLLTKYDSVMNKFRMKCLIIAIICVSLFMAIIAMFFMSFPLHMATIAANIIVIGAVYIIYTALLYRLDKQSAKHNESPGSCERKVRKSFARKRRSRRKRDIAVVRTVKILLGTIFVMYMPYNVLTSIWTYYKLYKREDPGVKRDVAVFWSYICLFMNSIANVLVYGYGNGKIRNYVVSFVRKSFSGDNSNNKSFQETSSLWKQDDKAGDTTRPGASTI